MYKDIDEAIREHKACAREQRKRASEPYELYPNICRKCAEEHEQLVEWLEELKALKDEKQYWDMQNNKAYEQGRQDEREEWECAVADKIIKHDEDIYKALPEVIEKVRADAIDEFVNFINTMPTYENEYGEIMPMPIEMMAEQLKESRNEEDK